MIKRKEALIPTKRARKLTTAAARQRVTTIVSTVRMTMVTTATIAIKRKT
jgi:hypothetical protein